MKTGIELISDERQRQISKEGWTPEHDDKHEHGQLAAAAVSYTDTALIQITWSGPAAQIPKIEEVMMNRWPWNEESFKASKDPIRNLVKAGALIAAEIDRLERLRVVNG